MCMCMCVCMCMCMCMWHVACARRSVHAPRVVGRGRWAVGMCGAVRRRAQCICGGADGLLVAAQEALGAVDRVEHPRAPRRRPAQGEKNGRHGLSRDALPWGVKQGRSPTSPPQRHSARGRARRTWRTHARVHTHARTCACSCIHMACTLHMPLHMPCTCRAHAAQFQVVRTLPPPSPSPRLRRALSRGRPLRRRRPSSARSRRPQQRASRRPRRAGAPTSPPQ